MTACTDSEVVVKLTVNSYVCERCVQIFPLIFVSFARSLLLHCKTIETYNRINLSYSRTMDSSDGFRNHDCRGAIALNNMGVSLLEQKAYSEAMETLKDSVIVMKVAFQQESCTNFRDTGILVEEKLDRACQRLSTQRLEADPTLIEGLRHDGGFATLQSLVTKQDPILSESLFPVRIEQLDDHEDIENSLKTAIIMHNFSIAHFCMSKTPVNDEVRARLVEGGLRLASVSYGILSKMMSGGKNLLYELILRDTNVFVVAIAVLNSLVQMLIALGSLGEAERCSAKLHQLGALVKQIDSPEFTQSNTVAAAAA